MSTERKDVKVTSGDETTAVPETYDELSTSVGDTQKNTWKKLMPVIACGAGLFSDGYLNNVCLSTIHPSVLATC
jgi:hypothetical protein